MLYDTVMVYEEGTTEEIILYHVHVLVGIHVVHLDNLIVRETLNARLVYRHYYICPNQSDHPLIGRGECRRALLCRLLGPYLGCTRLSSPFSLVLVLGGML